jgi:hypothetical protein
MANTRRARPGPTRSKQQPQPVEEFDTFDEMMADGAEEIEPLVLPVPQWDPETDERIADTKEVIPCPTGDDMEDWNTAVRSGDDYNAYLALYPQDIAERYWRATGKLPFVKRATLMGKVLVHYQLQASNGMGLNPQS